MSPNQDPESLLSRSGQSDPAGKLTNRLDVPCTDELFEAVGAMAMLEGVPRSEWVRRVLQRELYGSLGMARSLIASARNGDGSNSRELVGSAN